jgi:hypothetical protein
MRLVPLIAAAVWIAPAAHAQERKANPYLVQAKVFYQGLEYEKCLGRLDNAYRWQNSEPELAEIELYMGLCSFQLGRAEDAKERFVLSLQLNPQIQLPPFTSPKIVQLFDELAARVPDREVKKPDEKRVDVPLSSPPTLVTTPSKPIPWLPIGLGSAAVAGVGTGIFFGIEAKRLEGLANDPAEFEINRVRYGDQARRSAVFANVAYGLAASLAVSAVVTYFFFPPKSPAQSASK